MTTVIQIYQHLKHHNFPQFILDAVAMHKFTDEMHQEKLDNLPPNSVDRIFAEMKRTLLVEQVRRELKELSKSQPEQVRNDRCMRCGTIFYYREETSEDVCPGCGTCVFRLENRFINYKSRDNYNCNARHHYAWREHFFQTLLDVTCTGSRNVPDKVMRFCRKTLGVGMHVTFSTVFETLKRGGYSAHYPSIHFIAACLRGRAEIILTSQEMRKVRSNYLRYDKHFATFLDDNNLSNKTQRGKRRMYWPFRFIMAEMFKLIGREDLTKFLRGIAGKKREAGYKKWWSELTKVVDGYSKPIPVQTQMPELIMLTSSKRKHRPKARR